MTISRVWVASVLAGFALLQLVAGFSTGRGSAPSASYRYGEQGADDEEDVRDDSLSLGLSLGPAGASRRGKGKASSSHFPVCSRTIAELTPALKSPY
jgi:hypothetical protein